MRISDWSSDVCSTGLFALLDGAHIAVVPVVEHHQGHRQTMALGRGQLLQVPAEAAVARDGHHAAPAPADRGAQRHRKPIAQRALVARPDVRSEEHTSELQSLMRISYAVFCLKKKTKENQTQ